MLLYYNTSTILQKADKVLLPEQEKLSFEKDFFKYSMNLLTVAFSLKVNLFDSWSIQHQHQLLQYTVKFSKLRAENNAEYILKNKELHKILISLKFQGVVYYENSTAFVLLLNDVEGEVLKVYLNESKINLN